MPLYLIADKYHIPSISHFQFIIKIYSISKVITKCKLSFALKISPCF